MSSKPNKDEQSEVSLLQNDHHPQLTEQSKGTLPSTTVERNATNFRPDEDRGPAIAEDILLKDGHLLEKTPLRKTRTVSFSDDVSVSFTDDVYENIYEEIMNDKVWRGNRRSKMEVDDDVDVPYDRGWAWVVDLACFVLMFVYISHDNWHSVLFMDYLREFDIPVSVVTIMMSIGTACYCISTQVSTNVLVARFSIRVVLTSAAIMNVSATLLFSAAPNVGTFFIANFIKYSTKGITIIATLVLVGLYFRKRRGLATTLGLLGMSASFVCVPPLIRFLREEYGFRGCFLILAGLEMHGIVAALLLRPINSYKRKKPSQETTQEATIEKVNLVTMENPEDISKSASKSKLLDHNQMTEILNNLHIPRSEITEISISETKDAVNDNKGIIKTDGDNNIGSPQKIKIEDSRSRFHPDQNAIELSQVFNDQLEGINEVASPSENSVNKNAVNKSNQEMTKIQSDTQEYGFTVGHKEMDESAKSVHESEWQKVNDKEESIETTVLVRPDLTSPLNDVDGASKLFHASSLSLVFSSTMGSTLNIPHVIEIQNPEPPQQQKPPKRNWIRELIDFSLLTNYLALMIAAMYILVNTCSLFSVVFLPSYAVSVGVSPQEASILLTVYGAMDIVGRLGFGILVDLKLLRPHLMIAASCAVLGTITQFIPLFTDFQTLILYSVVLGLLGSTGQNLSTVLIVDVVGIGRLGKLLPLCSMFNSFAMTIQHPIHGGIIQATGTFITSFHYTGTCGILASLLLLCEPFIRKLQNKKEKKQTLKRLSGKQP